MSWTIVFPCLFTSVEQQESNQATEMCISYDMNVFSYENAF